MKIALGEKVNYYSECPFCGTPREEGRDSCVKCGRSLIETVEKKDDPVIKDDEDDMSLYKTREEKSQSETFKSLTGKAKWNYFKDYYLAKIIVAVIIVALLGSLIYTSLKPKPENAFYTAIVVSPFIPAAQDQFEKDLTELLVTDTKKEEIYLDTTYSSLIADYNSMLSYTMHLTAGEIDMVILSKDELKYQVNSKSLVPITDVVSKEVFDKIDESAKYSVLPTYLQDNGEAEFGEEAVYGLNIEKFLEKINGFETSNKYCVAFTCIAPHKDKIDTVVKYLFDIK